MMLTEQEFKDIQKVYRNLYRSLGQEEEQPIIPVKVLYIKNIRLDYAFVPQNSKEWQDIQVILYKSEDHQRNHNMTYSPEPNDKINQEEWLSLMQEEGQLLQDMWSAKNVKPQEWSYDSETTDFLFKKALLAIDVANRYHAWGDKMYDMFKITNPKHAEFFVRAVYMSNTSNMLANAHSALDYVDVKTLNAEQRKFWAKLMLYVVDKRITLEIYDPKQKLSLVESRDWAYRKFRESGFSDLIEMVPPEEKIEPGYLGMAMSYIGSLASNGLELLPKFRAQQNQTNSEHEKLIATKIAELTIQLNEKLELIPNRMPVKAANTIIKKINELFDYTSENKIDITNNQAVNTFNTTNFNRALQYLNQVPADAAIDVQERAQLACEAFKLCYAKNAALLKKVTANNEILTNIDALTSRFEAAPKESKKLR